MQTDERREEARRAYEWFKAHKICAFCKGTRTDGVHVCCDRCREKQKLRMRERKAKNPNYNEEHTKYCRERRERYRAMGLCHQHTKTQLVNGICPKCHEENHIRWLARKEKQHEDSDLANQQKVG